MPNTPGLSSTWSNTSVESGCLKSVLQRTHGKWVSEAVAPLKPLTHRLATASEDQSLRPWDARTGQEIMSLCGQTDAANHVAFSVDGHRLAAASSDGTVRIWEAPAQ